MKAIQMSTDWWKDQQNAVHKYDRTYSALKNKTLVHAITGMNPGNIMLSGRSQTQKDKYYESTYKWYLE